MHSATRSSTWCSTGPHVADGIDQAGRPDHLLDEDAAGLLHLPGAGRGRDVKGLGPHRVPFLEVQGPVVDAGGQAEAVFRERDLAAVVAPRHPADLRHRDVAFVDEQERVVGQIFEQSRRRLAGIAAGQIAGVVLDTGAGPGRLDHFQIELGALADPLGFEIFPGRGEGLHLLLQLDPDMLHGLGEGGARRHIVAVRIELDVFQRGGLLAGQRIEFRNRFKLVAEQGQPPGIILVMRREDLDHVAPHAEGASRKGSVVALVLQRHEIAQKLVAVDPVADLQAHGHRRIGLDRADAVDAGDAGDDDHVVALQERAGGRVPHPVDLLVHRGFLLDISVGARDIGLGLVIVVIGDEILDRVVGEEALEFAVKLGRERLVGRQHQGRALHRLDHLGHGEGLARARDAQEHLVALGFIDAVHQRADGFGLVAGGHIVRDQLELDPALGLLRPRRAVRHEDLGILHQERIGHGLIYAISIPERPEPPSGRRGLC